MTKYFAYGSNLWRSQMTSRCPESKVAGNGRLNSYRWIISTRGYATIVYSINDEVCGTVYDLSETDEASLDKFEGVADGIYRKTTVTVDLNGASTDCLTYIDTVDSEGKPKPEYILRINSGLTDAKLPEEYIKKYIRKFIPAQNREPESFS